MTHFIARLVQGAVPPYVTLRLHVVRMAIEFE
jgi:hypothetical protein